MGEEEEADSDEEVRWTTCNGKIASTQCFYENPETTCSGPQTQSRGEESKKIMTGEKTIQTCSRTDRSGHSVLQTLGQAQGGVDYRGDVGYEKFLIEYDVV